jgi:hypothetical protein
MRVTSPVRKNIWGAPARPETALFGIRCCQLGIPGRPPGRRRCRSGRTALNPSSWERRERSGVTSGRAWQPEVRAQGQPGQDREGFLAAIDDSVRWGGHRRALRNGGPGGPAGHARVSRRAVT